MGYYVDGISSDVGGVVLFSNYFSNAGPGLQLANGNAVVDLSGSHTGGNDYAGNNSFIHNNTSSSSTGAEIVLNGSTVKLGSETGTSTNDGRNNIVSLNQDAKLIVNSSGSVALNDVNGTTFGLNQNFWGYGKGSNHYTLTGTSNNTLFAGNITYNIDPTNDASLNSTPNSDCDVGSPIAHHKGGSVGLSVTGDTLSQCARWFNYGSYNNHNKQTAAKAYDSLRLFIDSCGSNPQSYHAFPEIGTAVSYMGGSYDRYLTYRAWLKSVLFLNPNDNYYCSDLAGILGTFESYWPSDYNAAVAVVDFIVKTNRCDVFLGNEDLENSRSNYRRIQIQMYRDSVHDSLATPIDTTLPSLESIGLGVLLSGVAEQYAPHTGQEIVSFIAKENPFHRENEISFELGEIDAAQIEVFDLLGMKVFTSGRKVYPNGAHSVSIDIGSSPPGAYYVRMSTGHGDTRTIKLVKK